MKERELFVLNKIAEKCGEIYYDREPATVYYHNEVGEDEDEQIIYGLTQGGLIEKRHSSLVNLYIVTDKGAILLKRS